MSTPKIDVGGIDPKLIIYGAAGLAILYLTYKTTDAVGKVYSDITGPSEPSKLGQAISDGASSLWSSISDLWGEDPQYADITKSTYTPSQVAKIMPARTVELADSPATGPTFGGVANGDGAAWYTDPSTRIGVGPIGWQSTTPQSQAQAFNGWGKTTTLSGA
jgi:hypothetical protein